jgi:hypothetical protein
MVLRKVVALPLPQHPTPAPRRSCAGTVENQMLSGATQTVLSLGKVYTLLRTSNPQRPAQHQILLLLLTLHPLPMHLLLVPQKFALTLMVFKKNIAPSAKLRSGAVVLVLTPPRNIEDNQEP